MSERDSRGQSASLRIRLALPDPPLPFGSAASRWHYVLVRGLVERGHQLITFAPCSKDAEREAVADLFPQSQYDVRLFDFDSTRRRLSKLKTLREPFAYNFGSSFRSALNHELSRDFDLLHLEVHWTGWLGRSVTRRALLHILHLLAIDQPEPASSAFADRLRHRWLLAAERRVIRAYPNLSTLTPRLSEHVQAMNPLAHVDTIPLGFDLKRYPFACNESVRTDPVVGLIGSYHWGPTRSAALRLVDQIWPAIHEQVPSSRLHLVGREAGAMFRGRSLPPEVSVFDNVPEILPHFRDLDVLVYAPSRGSGMKVKVLEAFALGVPVVTNSEGVEGIPARDGIEVGLSDGNAGLIQRAVTLLRDPAARRRQAEAARKLVEVTCDPDHCVGLVEDAYRGILRRNRNGAIGRDA